MFVIMHLDHIHISGTNYFYMFKLSMIKFDLLIVLKVKNVYLIAKLYNLSEKSYKRTKRINVNFVTNDLQINQVNRQISTHTRKFPDICEMCKNDFV